MEAKQGTTANLPLSGYQSRAFTCWESFQTRRCSSEVFHATDAVRSLLLILSLLVLSGCDTNQSAAPSSEDDSRERCAVGEYQDLASGSCVVPTTISEAQRLSFGDRLLNLSQNPRSENATDSAVVLARVVFARGTTPDSWSSAMQALAPTAVTHLNILLPDFDYGTTLAYDLKLDTGYRGALDDLAEQALETERKHGGDADALSHALDGGPIHVQFTEVRSTPGKLVEWWREHSSTVYYVQPIADDLDRAQPVILPGDAP